MGLSARKDEGCNSVGLRMPKGVTHAIQSRSVKGEDTYSVLKGGQATSSAGLYAVFDGHGGTKACSHCAGKLAPFVQSLGVAAKDDAVQDAFWSADAELGGEEGKNDGSTATILVVDDRDAEGTSGLLGMLAWVGDSQGVVVDLAKSSATGAPVIVAETTRHVATDDDEQKRLQQTWQVSRKLRLSGAGKQQTQAPSVAAVHEAARGLGLKLSDDAASVIARARDALPAQSRPVATSHLTPIAVTLGAAACCRVLPHAASYARWLVQGRSSAATTST